MQARRTTAQHWNSTQPLIRFARVCLPCRFVSSRPLASLTARSAARREVAGAEERASPPVLDHAFRHEGPSLLRFLRRRVGYDDAPDMLQEVFLRAVGSRQAGHLANPAAFLRRIARNLLIDRARRQSRNPAAVFPLDEAVHAAAPPEQDHALIARDLLRRYEAAVDRLPDKTRRVFLMHRVDEMSYREIHEQLGISIATVEYHMMKALAQITRALDRNA